MFLFSGIITHLTSPGLSALATSGTMTMTWEEAGVSPTREDMLGVDMLSALAPSLAMAARTVSLQS